MEFNTSEEVGGGGGNFLTQPGTYHMIVTRMEESPTKRSGELIRGGVFRATMQVLAGTSGEDEKGREIALVFFEPDLSSKDEGKWNRRKITAFLLAVDLMTPADLGKSLKFDLSKAEGRQLIVTLEVNDRDEQKRLQIAWDNLYHVDHPDAAKFPKDSEHLDLLPASLRHKPEYWGEKEPTAQQPVAASASSVSLDDL